MLNRPKISIELTPFGKILESAGTLLLLVLWGLTGYMLFTLQGQIPIHYDASGKPNGYGSKMTLLFLSVLATVIYVGLTWLNKYPHLFNYITKITDKDAERQYTMATRMVRILKVSVLLVFTLIMLFTYLTAIGVAEGPGTWFLPFTLVLFLLPTFIYLTKLLRAK